MQWSDSELRFINKVVKAHDRDLFAERSHLGHIRIMRKSKRSEVFLAADNTVMSVYRDAPQFVCALTDDWTANGSPVSWGSEVVVNRLKKHDVWNNEALFADIEKEQQRAEESREKDLRNKNEAWLSDNHGLFKKAFNDVRVANFDKSERRRRRFDKNLELKN